jgi:hypothetical protein
MMDISDTLDHYCRGGVRAAVHTVTGGRGLITIARRRSFPFVSPSAALAAWFDFLAQVDPRYGNDDKFFMEETDGNATH